MERPFNQHPPISTTAPPWSTRTETMPRGRRLRVRLHRAFRWCEFVIKCKTDLKKTFSIRLVFFYVCVHRLCRDFLSDLRGSLFGRCGIAAIFFIIANVRMWHNFSNYRQHFSDNREYIIYNILSIITKMWCEIIVSWFATVAYLIFLKCSFFYFRNHPMVNKYFHFIYFVRMYILKSILIYNIKLHTYILQIQKIVVTLKIFN